MKWMITCTILLLGFTCISSALAASDTPEEYQLQMDFIENSLDESRQHARYWYYGWSTFYGVSGVVQTAQWIDADNNDDRVNYAIGALKSVGGLADMLLKPHPGRNGSAPLQAMPQDTPEQKSKRLESGESILMNSAQRAESRHTWKAHLKVIGVNLIAGALIAGFGDDDDALTSTAIGIAVGEANIWTQPTRAEGDWREYQQKYSQPAGMSWEVVPFGAGLAIAGRF